MPIKYKKIVVTAEELSFEPGAYLGLDTGKQNRLAEHVKQLKGGVTLLKGEYQIVLGVSFKKGDVLWVDEKCLPQIGEGSFRVVPMAKSYQELLSPTLSVINSATIGGQSLTF